MSDATRFVAENELPLEISPGQAVEAADAGELTRTEEALLQARTALENELTGEFVAADLRRAADALGEITGAISTEDILDRIFSEFCIGK